MYRHSVWVVVERPVSNWCRAMQSQLLFYMWFALQDRALKDGKQQWQNYFLASPADR